MDNGEEDLLASLRGMAGISKFSNAQWHCAVVCWVAKQVVHTRSSRIAGTRWQA
jgi:hypothetical protein